MEFILIRERFLKNINIARFVNLILLVFKKFHKLSLDKINGLRRLEISFL